jgi:hypothetical protein
MRAGTGAAETQGMLSSPTTYRSGSRVVEVLPGESHSAAWAFVTRRGPRPSGCAGAGRVRRRAHAARRHVTRGRAHARVA